MPTKDIKQKTTKRRSTSKSNENKRKVHRKSSTQLKKGGVIGQLYNTDKYRYEVKKKDYNPIEYDKFNQKYNYNHRKINYDKPYLYEYTQPRPEIDESKIDFKYNQDIKEDTSKVNVKEMIRNYPIPLQAEARNEFTPPKLERQNAFRSLINKFNNGGRKVKKVTKKPEDPKKKVTKKPVVPKKKVTKKPADPKKKVTKKPVVPKKKVTKK